MMRGGGGVGMMRGDMMRGWGGYDEGGYDEGYGGGYDEGGGMMRGMGVGWV